MGLQFHLEATPESVAALCGASALDEGEWVQSEEEIRRDDGGFAAANDHLFAFLDAVAEGEK